MNGPLGRGPLENKRGRSPSLSRSWDRLVGRDQSIARKCKQPLYSGIYGVPR